MFIALFLVLVIVIFVGASFRMTVLAINDVKYLLNQRRANKALKLKKAAEAKATQS